MEKTYSFKTYKGHKYTVAYIDDLFCLQDDEAAAGQKCKYFVKVEPDHNYTYKVLKTKIKAKDGAAGLFDFIRECYEIDILQCAVEVIIEKIITGYVKAA